MAGEWVPCEDQCGIGFADGWDECGQACLADGLRFIDPADVDAFDAFDGLEIVMEPAEDETAADGVAASVSPDFEALQAEFFDGSGEELVDGVGNGVLEFSGAEDGDWLYGGS